MSQAATESQVPQQVEIQNFAGFARSLVGQKVAVICARYQYRGILSHVSYDCCIIADATCVEISGASGSERPETEDPIRGTVCIKHDAIEIMYQPHWCFAPLPSEDGYGA